MLRSVSPCAASKAVAILLQSELLDKCQHAVSVAVVLRHFFVAIGLATVIAAGLGWTQRAQAPNAVLGRVDGGVVEGDGMHSAARTEAISGDRGSGAEMRDRAARTEEGGGGEGGGAEMRNRAARTEARGRGGGRGGGRGSEMRDQAEHVIAVTGELIKQCWRVKARKDGGELGMRRE